MTKSQWTRKRPNVMPLQCFSALSCVFFPQSKGVSPRLHRRHHLHSDWHPLACVQVIHKQTEPDWEVQPWGNSSRFSSGFGCRLTTHGNVIILGCRPCYASVPLVNGRNKSHLADECLAGDQGFHVQRQQEDSETFLKMHRWEGGGGWGGWLWGLCVLGFIAVFRANFTYVISHTAQDVQMNHIKGRQGSVFLIWFHYVLIH